jgi:hypothetical protein
MKAIAWVLCAGRTPAFSFLGVIVPLSVADIVVFGH